MYDNINKDKLVTIINKLDVLINFPCSHECDDCIKKYDLVEDLSSECPLDYIVDFLEYLNDTCEHINIIHKICERLEKDKPTAPPPPPKHPPLRVIYEKFTQKGNKNKEK